MTDLAYMRTVGILETSDSSPSAPRKAVTTIDKAEKALVKSEKANKANSLVSDVNKEVRKSSQKSYVWKEMERELCNNVCSVLQLVCMFLLCFQT